MDQSGYQSKTVGRWYDWQAAFGAGLRGAEMGHGSFRGAPGPGTHDHIQPASDAGLPIAHANWSKARGSVLQLLMNVTVLIVIGAASLRLQRIIWRRRSPAKAKAAAAPRG
jgi:hypothetical protein